MLPLASTARGSKGEGHGTTRSYGASKGQEGRARRGFRFGLLPGGSTTPAADVDGRGVALAERRGRAGVGAGPVVRRDSAEWSWKHGSASAQACLSRSGAGTGGRNFLAARAGRRTQNHRESGQLVRVVVPFPIESHLVYKTPARYDGARGSSLHRLVGRTFVRHQARPRPVLRYAGLDLRTIGVFCAGQ